MKRVLALETSCDDTAVAVVEADGRVLSSCSANQDLVHAPFGGIVPEIASRSHTEHLLPLVEVALKQAKTDWREIHGIALTNRPGLIGSLMVGLVTGKALALTENLPFVGINHIEGHILAPFLRDESSGPPAGFGFPYLALIVSGGHSHIFDVRGLGQYDLLGCTVDDAAGEAFDKFAKMVGLGFPGGPKVDRAAERGNPAAFAFPRALMIDGDLRLSFSGLKTAAQRVLNALPEGALAAKLSDLCASFQQAVVEALFFKLEQALLKTGRKTVVISGGVSANSQIRRWGEEWAQRLGVLLVVPPLRYCTDNAAMIGYAGVSRLARGERHAQDLSPSASAWDGDYRDRQNS